MRRVGREGEGRMQYDGAARYIPASDWTGDLLDWKAEVGDRWGDRMFGARDLWAELEQADVVMCPVVADCGR